MSLDALLAAVRAAPDADLPRLMYADALEDAGQPERAEFIRAQCELARLPEWDDRRPGLEDREHDLLDRQEAEWLGIVSGGPEEWEWRRGFVDEIRVTDLANPLPGLADEHPIRLVACHSYNTADEGDLFADSPGWCRTVERLDLSHTTWLGADDLVTPLAEDRLPRLVGLNLSGSAAPSFPEFWQAFPELPLSRRLTHLTVDEDYDPPEPADVIDAVAGCPLTEFAWTGMGLSGFDLLHLLGTHGGRLTDLRLGDQRFGNEAAGQFHRLPADAPLARLDVSGSPMATSLGRLLTAPGLGRLTDLDVSRTADLPLGLLAASDFWQRATSLRLRACRLTPEAIQPLCEAVGPPGLRLLDLGDNPLGSDGVRRLLAARWGRSLTWLGLTRTNTPDQSLAAMAMSGPFPHLRTLHLTHNPVTDAGVALLANAPGLARLRILTLSHTGVTGRVVPQVIDAPYWRLTGLGLAGCDLSAPAVEALARSPRLRRLQWLDLSDNPWLRGNTLLPLAESPHLSRLCELDVGGCGASDRARAVLRQRLGRRLSD